MPLLNKRSFQKKEPWRDATIFIIVCEGSNKEPSYFDFFDRLTSKLKVVAIPSEDGKSSPNHLIGNAEKSVEEYNSDQGTYELWFVIDLDKWLAHGHIHDLHQDCKGKENWHITISNPCFEVWLCDHFQKGNPSVNQEACKSWKHFLHEVSGGFDPMKHPTLVPIAIKNSKKKYQEEGFVPNVGCTQLHRLAERILRLTDGILDKYLES